MTHDRAMAKKKNGRSRHRRRRNGGGDGTKSKAPTSTCSNFVSGSAGHGCYIARREVENDWLLEWQDNIDVSEFGCGCSEAIPDVALDPQDSTVTFCNVADDITKVAYITIYEATVRGKAGQVLLHGSTTDNDGNRRACLTFIILCPPRTFAHLCTMDVLPERITDVEIDSDVQEWNQHSHPDDEHPLQLGFPLEGNNDGPFLCTQSEGGHLTHFFSGNLHAIDFQCPIGTPLLAVADGTVVEVKDDNTLTGIAVSNLFTWNSIAMEVNTTDDGDGPLYCEYVHIATSCVKVGDAVAKGQVIGTSGSVGFSPEPHLHFSAFRSRDATAATVRVRFASLHDEENVFLPVAGQWYTAEGQVSPPSKEQDGE